MYQRLLSRATLLGHLKSINGTVFKATIGPGMDRAFLPLKSFVGPVAKKMTFFIIFCPHKCAKWLCLQKTCFSSCFPGHSNRQNLICTRPTLPTVDLPLRAWRTCSAHSYIIIVFLLFMLIPNRGSHASRAFLPCCEMSYKTTAHNVHQIYAESH